MRSNKVTILTTALFFAISVFSLSVMLSAPKISWAEEDNLVLGKKLYDQFCAQCHGEKGKGDGENAESMDPVPRDLTDSSEEYMSKLTNEEIVEVITKGGAGIDKSPKMPHFGMTLSDYEIAGLCDYVRTLHPNNVGQVIHAGLSKERPKAEVNDVEIGEPKGKRALKIAKRYFKKNACGACHQVRGRGGTSGPALDGIGSKMSDKEIFKVIKDPLNNKDDSKMPNLALSDDVAIAITQYLLSL